jgi:biopolymer transport protein TolR
VPVPKLGGDGRGAGRYRPMAEINVTPLVDVMLVLLVIFNAHGQIFVQNAEVSTDTLVPRLKEATEANPDAPLYVRGDKEISYGRVLEVMSLVSAAGFHKVSLVAQTPPASASRSAQR